MTLRPDIQFRIVLAIGGLGLAACLASIVVEDRLAGLLLGVGAVLLFPAVIFMASRVSGRPVNDLHDVESRPIRDAVLQLALPLIVLAQLVLRDGFTTRGGPVNIALETILAVATAGWGYRLIRAIINWRRIQQTR